MTDAAVAESSTCCNNHDDGSAAACALCETAICGNCLTTVNGQDICGGCFGQVQSEIAAEQGRAIHGPVAIIGGIVTAVLAGLIWCAVTVISGWQVGYVAVGVGWLVGKGILLITKGKKGRQLQMIAALSSVVALVLGTYLINAYFMHEYVAGEGADVSLLGIVFSGEFIKLFFTNPTEFFDGFDILWNVIAIGIAYRMLEPTSIIVGQASESDA